MHSLIERLLNKRGIKSIDDLKAKEREVYQAWMQVLTKPDTTIDDIKRVLPIETERVNAELRKYDNTERKELYLKAYANLLTFFTTLITSPEKQRNELKAQIEQQLNS